MLAKQKYLMYTMYMAGYKKDGAGTRITWPNKELHRDIYRMAAENERTQQEEIIAILEAAADTWRRKK